MIEVKQKYEELPKGIRNAEKDHKINIPESFQKRKNVEFPSIADVKRAIDCGQIRVHTINNYIVLTDGEKEVVIENYWD